MYHDYPSILQALFHLIITVTLWICTTVILILQMEIQE